LAPPFLVNYMSAGLLNSNVNTGKDSELLSKFVTPLSISSNKPSYTATTLSLRQLRSSQNVQRWEIETRLEPSNDVNAGKLLAFFAEHNHSRYMYLRMPQIYTLQPSKDVKVSVARSKGTSTVTLNKDMKVGEFIQFEGSYKVYMVIATGYNGVDVGIEPQLATDIVVDQVVRTGDNVTLRTYLDDSMRLGVTYENGIIADVGVMRFNEAI
jgi:hypothetical protein